jgi:acyl-CoA synthetase (NDP forming)
MVEKFLEQSPAGGWLPPLAVAGVLAAAGIAAPRTLEVASADDAARAAAGLAMPVVVKATGPDLVHKSDIGGVRLGIASAEDAAAAYGAMAQRIGPRMTGAVVQEMAAPGVETIAGVVQDPLFGPLVMFGLGGTATELLGDRGFRILPLTDNDAAELVRSLRSSPLLFGYRGAEPVAIDVLEGVLQRIARLAGTLAELAEVEVNPLIVSPSGAVAVDARIKVVPSAPRPPDDLRRMR